MESSEIDLSEFQEQNHNDGAGGGNENDNNRDANYQEGNDTAQQAAGNGNDQVGNDAAQQATGNNGKVPPNFTLKASLD